VKLHPGSKWANTGPLASSVQMQPPPSSTVATHISLSEAAQSDNASYAVYSQNAHLQNDEQDEEPMILVNDNVDEDNDGVANKLNCSMATYGSKSPEKPMLSISMTTSGAGYEASTWQCFCICHIETKI
jgi:hypothetical protein